LQAFPGLNIAVGTTNGILTQRTKALIADSNDDLVLQANLSGGCAVSHRGFDFNLGARQATLLTAGDVGSLTYAEPASYLTLSVPLNALAQRMGSPESALMRLVPDDNGVLRLLLDYIAMTMDKHTPMNADLHTAFVTHVHDLVGLAFGATRDGAALALGRGVRAARLTAMKADILARLQEEGLSVHDIARRHGVTPRYVQMLFDADGKTFSEFVIAQRLERAHRMLADMRYLNRTISAIAFEVGFSNLSYFNRTFLRRYGATPSDIREQARRNGV